MKASTFALGAAVTVLAAAAGQQFVPGFARAVQSAPVALATNVTDDMTVPGPLRSNPVEPVAVEPIAVELPRSVKPGRAVIMPPNGRNAAAVIAAAQSKPGIGDKRLVEGTFRDGDRDHKGAGYATIWQTSAARELRLTGFRSSEGPDLRIQLVAKAEVKKDTDLVKTKILPLGMLKSPAGDQTYLIPNEVDLAPYKSVVIWSGKAQMVFSAASLKPAS